MQTHMLEPNRRVMEWLPTGRWEFPDPHSILTGVTAPDAGRMWRLASIESCKLTYEV